MEAYCVKCRARREITDPQAITMKNGKPATQGGVSLLRHQGFPNRRHSLIEESVRADSSTLQRQAWGRQAWTNIAEYPHPS